MTGFTLFIVLFGPYLPFVDEQLKSTLVLRDADGKLLVPPIPPSSDYLFGTDATGRDLLSRLVMGARQTMAIVLSIVVIRQLFAVVLAISAFYSKLANIVMAFWNRLFTFMPSIFFIIIVLNAPFVMFSEQRALWSIFIIALAEAGRVAFIFYGTMEEMDRKPFMEAAVSGGGTPIGIFKRHHWPVLKGHLFVQTISELGRTMFVLAQLAILNIFILQVFMSQETRGVYSAVNTSHTWPTFFENLRHDILASPWIPIATFGAITFVMIGFYLFADGLNRRMLMKQRKFV